MITQRQIAIDRNIKGFVEYKPDAWDGVKKIPLVIFCHGIGEMGTDLNAIMRIGLPAVIASGKFNEEAVILMPQFTAWPAWFSVESMITYGLKNYAIDPDRVTLTGLSMGGAAILDWGEYGDISRVAALAPVCPASEPQPFGQRFVDAKIPFFFTVGDLDSNYKPSTLRWVDFLNSRGITPKAQNIIVPNTAHNSWDFAYNPASTAYNGSTLIKWLLSQHRGGAVVAPAPVKKLVSTVFLYDDNTYEIKTAI